MSTWEAQNSTWRTARILWLECIHMTWHERFEETGLKKPQKDLACSKELLSWKDAFLVGANMVSSASGAQNLLSSAGICSSLRAENHFVTLVRKHVFLGENLLANSESSQIESHFQENLNLTRPKVPQARAGKSLKLACAHSSRWQKPPACKSRPLWMSQDIIPTKKARESLARRKPRALHLPLACVCGPWLEL